MSPRSGRRHRRHQRLLEHQSREQKQIAAQLSKLGGTALSQPIFLVDSGRHITVSRSMPEVLAGRMDDSSWNTFCDELDEALLPLAKMKKTMKRCGWIPLAFFIPLVLVGLVATSFVASRSMDGSGSGDGMRTVVLPIIFLIALLGTIAWAIGMANYSSRCKRKVNERLEKICYETSTSHSGVTFKVYLELHYMPVIVANDSAEALELQEVETKSKSSCSTEITGSVCTAPTSTQTLTPEEFAEAKKWRTAIDETTNTTYYFNEETQEVTWEHPLGGGKVNAKKDDNSNGNVRLGGGENRKKVAAEPEIEVVV